jgi:hypothetical protein
MMTIAATLVLDVSAEGGLSAGPVWVRSDGRLGFGARAALRSDDLKRFEELLKKPGRQPLEVLIEKGAEAKTASQVLQLVRAQEDPSVIPEAEWTDARLVLKTPGFRLVVDLEGNLQALQADMIRRRSEVKNAYRKAVREGGAEAAKLQQALQAVTQIYTETFRRARAGR